MTSTDNPYRLARSVVPRHYELTLEPDLGAAKFDGTVTVALEVTEAVSQVALNSRELDIGSVTVTQGGGAIGHTHRLDDDTERLVISLSDHLQPGKAQITIHFSGILNDKLRGFYRSTYKDADGIEHVIAASQMQPTDCRSAFPCWDEPDFKATFGVTLIVADGLTAISNSHEISRVPQPDGRLAVKFADSMVMSTYLIAFIVGELEATEPVDVHGTPVRVVHVPGKGHLTQFGLDCGVFSLDWFEKYYDIPYPGTKVDLVALPDFAAGAMENVGCVTFRENLLLVDPATSTQTEQETVADVVCHELAHMWFGDLVTMRWWNGIWLNEAFATFMEIAACEAWRPDWRRWTTFSLERTVAFDTDSLESTRSVEFEVNSPNDSEGMFDVLTYQKGGALLRMLEQYLGVDEFRDGIRHYLRTHSYGNTETGDLWDAIEHVTGQPARRLMDSWIWQPGYPLISASLDGNEIVLRQQRFGFSDRTTSDPQTWVVPIHVRQVAGGSAATSDDTGVVAAIQERKVLMEGDEARVPLIGPDAVVVVNAGGHGFVRVNYDDSLRARLGTAALSGLSTIERYALIDDAWASVVAGRLSAEGFLALAEGFTTERELQVWQALAMGLRGCSRLVDGPALDNLRSRVRDLAKPALDRLGWEPAPHEGDLTSKLRGVLIGVVAVIGCDHATQNAARALFDVAAAGGDIDPELVSATTSVVAATGDTHDYERFLDGFRNAATPQEQLRNLYALAEFDDAVLIERTCEFAISGEVRTQNAPFLLNRCIANRNHGAAAWSYVRRHWQQANETFPIALIARMIDPVKLLNLPEQEADVQAFFGEHAIPQAAKTLDQILERQRVNVALRTRENERFAAALSRR